ncbi:hypothetical protein J31TS6_07850 [Brevibacillus reuszeri]|uniref:hypothetical protein n=1 Tax=Brevibacillus reuszeri TaxID=54915 RepID=UPI001B0EE25B|nr:hypothetical protein [Brevibacillus reuszeri]GIO04757.1 hypothetical protein J31TS6_07850 [Brevibacillus reuszeri]
MIQIQWDGTDGETSKLFINGIDVTKHEDIRFYWSNVFKKFFLTVFDPELTEIITEMSIKDIPKELARFTIAPLEFFDDGYEIEIVEDEMMSILKFRYYWDWEQWKKPYSIQEFANIMEKLLPEYQEQGLSWVQEDEIITNGCHIRYVISNNTQLAMKDILEGIEPVLKEILERAYAYLYSKTSSESLVSIFNFPPQVQTVCEQYLIYFAEFLKDIGIEATVNLNSEAGKLLFSVTPASNNDALEQIKRALDVYLQLPVSIGNANYVQFEYDLKVQQLIANVQHLNSQLRLSQALAQAQQVTIQNQQVTIAQQQQFIDATILQQALVSNEIEDKEEILGGAVSITKYQGNGFEVNIPNIFRWTKRLIGKE